MITRYELISIILKMNEEPEDSRQAVAEMTDSELKQVFRFFKEIRRGYYLITA